MALIHNLGFPRIGARRELKFALESFWKGQKGEKELISKGRELRGKHWMLQEVCDLVPVNDFSFYDHVLDMSFLLGNIPGRVAKTAGTDMDRYFMVARGRSASRSDGSGERVRAGEMTKWFDTNYHYIVPEFDRGTRFRLDSERLLSQLGEVRKTGFTAKPVLVGPVTYLWLGKTKDNSARLDFLDSLLPVYRELLLKLAEEGVEWVQMDEPILVTGLEEPWKVAFEHAYQLLADTGVKILTATYFGELMDNMALARDLPVAGLHVDAVRGRKEIAGLLKNFPGDKVISLGVIDGRNVWRSDLGAVLDWLEPVARNLGDRLWVAPSCSLLHVPVDLEGEEKMDREIRSWLAFAAQKLEELHIIRTALNEGRTAVAQSLEENRKAIDSRKSSSRVHNAEVKEAVRAVEATSPDGNGAGDGESQAERLARRCSSYAERSVKQCRRLRLPLFPTTTIGSFPQTSEIRRTRLQFRRGEIGQEEYTRRIRKHIEHCVREQEELGLDVLVHGEAERNDMVEYFGEQLNGYVFSQFGWVQSYGSRCVKPPIIFGDISRSGPMTVEWIQYAQSLTEKPVKGMLTGPVTILNWSFVRDDQPRSQTCMQLALALREEVLDLEKAGVGVIQIDEAALREGLPLRRSQWPIYLDWAILSFRISANAVQDETQIHTHMCYSEFNDIIEAIAAMDADVITIENSRSDLELLDVFERFKYPNGIGPGVYDIHSPNIPDKDQIVDLMKRAAKFIPAERLWVNPDCGLKTRQWEEVIPSLKNMVNAAAVLRHSV